jgi:hypothetical protein
MEQHHFDSRVGHSCYTSTTNIVTYFTATLATCKGVLNILISNLDTRYNSKHPTYLLLGMTKHLLMIAHKLSKVLITMRKDQQLLFLSANAPKQITFAMDSLSSIPIRLGPCKAPYVGSGYSGGC